MRPLTVAAYWLVGLAMSASAFAQPPAPGPEVKKLETWVGTWRVEGEAKASPMGPASKISAMQTARMVLNGFALEWSGEEQGPLGGVRYSELNVYDAASKSYLILAAQNDGTTWSGSMVVDGIVWKVNLTMTSKGVNHRLRSEFTPSPDGKTVTWRTEISPDGKTWALWTEGKQTRIK